MNHEALRACMQTFVAEMEKLGAVACVASYTVDAGDTWDGSNDGFGDGPALLVTLQGMLSSAQKHDVVAVCAAAMQFAEPPADVDVAKQGDILNSALENVGLPTRDAIKAAIRNGLTDHLEHGGDLSGSFEKDILLQGCRHALDSRGYENPAEAADNLAGFAADAVLAILAERAVEEPQ